MAGIDFQSVDDYIASQPEAVQSVLTAVRRAIRKAVPEADEVISYKMPTYRLPGGLVLYFAAWKKHISLYPASATLIDAFREDLTAYVIHKSTLRFPLSQPVPLALIGRIARFRANEAAMRKPATSAKSKKGGLDQTGERGL